MDREKFISILTDGYEFHHHLLEEVPLLRMMLIQLINDGDNEIWATVVKRIMIYVSQIYKDGLKESTMKKSMKKYRWERY